MLPIPPTPLVRLANLFPTREVYAKCEFLAPSGCFKIRGATHLLEHLQPGGANPATGRAVDGEHGPRRGRRCTGVRLRHDRRRAADHRPGQGREAASPGRRVRSRSPAVAATCCAAPPTSPRSAAATSCIPTWIRSGPTATSPSPPRFCTPCPTAARSCFPVGGGGLLMGLLAYLRNNPAPVRLFGCEPYNYPKYARFDHARSTTIADGLTPGDAAPAGAAGDRGTGSRRSPWSRRPTSGRR